MLFSSLQPISDALSIAHCCLLRGFAVIDNYCPIVHEDGGVTHYSGLRQLGSTASFNCDPGYNSTGSLTCLVQNKNNGKWSLGHGCECKSTYGSMKWGLALCAWVSEGNLVWYGQPFEVQFSRGGGVAEPNILEI